MKKKVTVESSGFLRPRGRTEPSVFRTTTLTLHAEFKIRARALGVCTKCRSKHDRSIFFRREVTTLQTARIVYKKKSRGFKIGIKQRQRRVLFDGKRLDAYKELSCVFDSFSRLLKKKKKLVSFYFTAFQKQELCNTKERARVPSNIKPTPST